MTTIPNTRAGKRASGVVLSEDTAPHGPRDGHAGPLSPIEKAAILLVGLDDALTHEILARLDPADVDTLTAAIDRLEPVDARVRLAVGREFYSLALRRASFRFEDIEHLADADLRAAYRDDQSATWALALAGAARPLQNRVLSVLKAGAAESLRMAISRIGPFRLDAVETAQEEIVARVRKLHDDALIDLPEPRGREEIVV